MSADKDKRKNVNTMPSHSAGPAQAGNRNEHGTDPVIPAAIGNKLRKLYGDVAREPVPDRFTELLEQLANREDPPK